MSIKTWTLQSTDACSKPVRRLGEAIERAEAIVIGAGAGMSFSAGFTYSGERFRKIFSDFIGKYHFEDMYSAGFYPFETPEEQWAFWSRYVMANRYADAPRPVYERLLGLVREKDYFVITTNVDHCFQKAGFENQRLFYTQGDYGLFQCSKPCCLKTYDNEASIRQMARKQEHMRIPSELVPYCPVCGRPVSMNLRADQTFAEDEGWHQAAGRYEAFLRGHRHTKTLFLDLGTGYNTPGIIKYSFWQMAYRWQDAAYACVNLNEAYAPEEIASKSICISADLGMVFDQIRSIKNCC